MFKAPFKLRDKKTLLKMLKRRDLNGEGGVFFDDVNESLPRAEKIVQGLTADGKVIQIPRPCDKKKVLFYYDHTTDLDLGELWKLATFHDETNSPRSAWRGRAGPGLSCPFKVWK